MTAFPSQNLQGRLAAAYLTWTDGAGNIQQLVFDLVESEDWTDGATVTQHPVEQGLNVADNVRVVTTKCMLKTFATNEPSEVNQWTGQEQLGITMDLPTVRPVMATLTELHVPEWQSNLELRVLAGAAGGVLGGAVGGPGSAASAVGSIAGSVAGAILLNGEVIYVPVQTSLAPPARPPSPSVTAQLTVPEDPDDFVETVVAFLQNLKNSAQLLIVNGTKQTCANMVIESIVQHRDADTGTGADLTVGFEQLRLVTTTRVPAPAPTVIRASTPVSGGNQNTTDDDSDSASVLYTTLHGYPSPAGG